VKESLKCKTDGGSRQSMCGGTVKQARRKGLNLFKQPRLSSKIIVHDTNMVTFCRPKKWLFLLIELCFFLGKNQFGPWLNCYFFTIYMY